LRGPINEMADAVEDFPTLETLGAFARLVEGLIRAIDQARRAVDQRVFQFNIALPLGLCSCAPSQNPPMCEGRFVVALVGMWDLLPYAEYLFSEANRTGIALEGPPEAQLGSGLGKGRGKTGIVPALAGRFPNFVDGAIDRTSTAAHRPNQLDFRECGRTGKSAGCSPLRIRTLMHLVCSFQSLVTQGKSEC